MKKDFQRLSGGVGKKFFKFNMKQQLPFPKTKFPINGFVYAVSADFFKAQLEKYLINPALGVESEDQGILQDSIEAVTDNVAKFIFCYPFFKLYQQKTGDAAGMFLCNAIIDESYYKIKDAYYKTQKESVAV